MTTTHTLSRSTWRTDPAWQRLAALVAAFVLATTTAVVGYVYAAPDAAAATHVANTSESQDSIKVGHRNSTKTVTLWPGQSIGLRYGVPNAVTIPPNCQASINGGPRFNGRRELGYWSVVSVRTWC